MKPARLIVLGVALFAGAIAFMLSGRETPPAPQITVVQPATDTVDILVARSDIQLGTALKPDDLAWQAWPVSAASPQFVRKSARPGALEEYKGAIARAPFIAGEPIREQKLIKADGSGFMSAILTPGMRAISTDISPETGVGGFILPTDRVDVILTRRDPDSQKQSGGDGFVSETILRNVRVLAIDQMVEEKNGQKVVVGKTATLELSPRQAETLALSRQRGTMSLALRSLAESKPSTRANADDEPDRGSGSVNFVRFGINSVQVLK
ncbi:MAG TPA: Flp pilus assembly protein CpaB [Xanthobacteraceae bacterium]|nr:Flp pilus assembly protein CpaB [Xanthobacteraceae bacterium]